MHPKPTSPIVWRSLLAALTLLLLLTPVSARAAVTQSEITTPAAPFYDRYTPPKNGPATESFLVTGNTNGTTGDTIDLRCVPGPGHPGPVPVAANGTFSVRVQMSAIGSQACRLRAVPTGFNGPDVTPFKAQFVSLTQYDEASRATPVHAAAGLRSMNFSVVTSHRRGVAQVFAAEDAGLYDFRAVHTDTLVPYNLASWYRGGTIFEPLTSAHTGIEVDGAAAYGSARVPLFDYDGAGPAPVSAPNGFTGVQSSVSVDRQSGDVLVVESETIGRCSGSNDKNPTAGQCTAIVSTGIRRERTYRLTREHALATFQETWTSTDERAHRVRVRLQHGVNGIQLSAWRVSGEDAFTTATNGDTRTPTRGGSLIARPVGGDDPNVAPGGIAFAGAAPTLTFGDAISVGEVAELDVPAGRSVSMDRTFATAPTVAGVEALLPPPEPRSPDTPARRVTAALAVTDPAEGSSTTAASTVVNGVALAGDDSAALTLTVGDRQVPIGADHRFSAAADLVRGVNTIPVVLTPQGGDPVTRTVTVRRIDVSRPVRPCIVPAVRRGATVAAARTALSKSGCRAKRHLLRGRSTVRKGRVVRLSLRPRAVRSPLTLVGIVVSKGRTARG